MTDLATWIENVREDIKSDDEMRLFPTTAGLVLDCLAAAERRQQVAAECNLNIAEWHDLEAAIDDEDAALAALTAHVGAGSVADGE